MKLRFLSKLKQFRWSKLLLIWLVFLLIAGVLFAERCGIKYASTNFKIDYLSRTSVLPAQNALFGQPVTNLLLYDSTQDNVSEAKKQLSDPSGHESQYTGSGYFQIVHSPSGLFQLQDGCGVSA